MIVFDGDSRLCVASIGRWRAATGGQIHFAPYQEMRAQLPQIRQSEVRRAVRFIGSDATLSSGAEAVLRAAAHCGRKRWLLWLYNALPALATVAELIYRLVVACRWQITIVHCIWYGKDLKRPTYHKAKDTQSGRHRPISDSELSAALLQNVLRVNFVAWSIIITACSVHTVIWMLGNQRVAEESRLLLTSSDLGLAAIPLALTASFIGGWTGTGLAASMMWTGRGRFVGTVVVSFVLLIASTRLLVRFVPDNWETPLERGIPWFCVAVIAAATIAAFTAAARRRLISVRTLLLAMVAWSVEVIVCWILLPAGTEEQLASPALLALTVAPLAAAPLAISWNRHR